eukprot:1374513-Pyramimonas_sp.AAC.1
MPTPVRPSHSARGNQATGCHAVRTGTASGLRARGGRPGGVMSIASGEVQGGLHWWQCNWGKQMASLECCTYCGRLNHTVTMPTPDRPPHSARGNRATVGHA